MKPIFLGFEFRIPSNMVHAIVQDGTGVKRLSIVLEAGEVPSEALLLERIQGQLAQLRALELPYMEFASKYEGRFIE
jgi:hypothetical protein